MWLVSFFVSCSNSEKFEDFPSSNIATSRSTLQNIEEARFLFAKSLNAALVADTNFRNYLKDRLLFVDSTNTEFIYLQYMDSIVYSSKTFASILEENTTAIDLSNAGPDFFHNIILVDPLLAISMPDEEGCDIHAWLSSNSIPEVAAVLSDPNGYYFKFNESNPNGTEVNVDPSVPTIAIWRAEAYYLINADGNTIDGLNLSDLLPSIPGAMNRSGECDILYELAGIALMNYEVYGGMWFLISHNQLMEQYYDCLEDEGNNSNPPGGEPCDCERDCEAFDERLVSFRINGWAVYQLIDNQRWENKFVFHADILAARDYSNGAAVPHTAKCVTPTYRKRDLLEGCGNLFSGGVCVGKWKTLDYRIWTDWNLEDFASPYYIDWAEVDHGAVTTSLNFPLTAKFKVQIPGIGEAERSVGVTVNYQRVGDKIVTLGNAPVFYCDPILMTNSTGSIEFKCN